MSRPEPGGRPPVREVASSQSFSNQPGWSTGAAKVGTQVVRLRDRGFGRRYGSKRLTI